MEAIIIEIIKKVGEIENLSKQTNQKVQSIIDNIPERGIKETDKCLYIHYKAFKPIYIGVKPKWQDVLPSNPNVLPLTSVLAILLDKGYVTIEDFLPIKKQNHEDK